MQTTGYPQIVTFDAFNTDAAVASIPGSPFETMALGSEVWAENRKFRYFLSGGAVNAAQLAQAPAEKTNHYGIAIALSQSLFQSATTTVPTTVSVTLGATAAVANEYNEGALEVVTGTGAGTSYKIGYSPAASSSGNLIVSLLESTAPVALLTAGSNTVNLVHNQFNGSLTATTQNKRVAGVPMVNVASGAYGWAITRGTALVIDDATAVPAGTNVIASSATAGSVTIQSSTFATAQAQVCIGEASLVAGTAGNMFPCFIEID